MTAAFPAHVREQSSRTIGEYGLAVQHDLLLYALGDFLMKTTCCPSSYDLRTFFAL
jgi:hypothetical protein